MRKIVLDLPICAWNDRKVKEMGLSQLFALSVRKPKAPAHSLFLESPFCKTLSWKALKTQSDRRAVSKSVQNIPWELEPFDFGC